MGLTPTAPSPQQEETNINPDLRTRRVSAAFVGDHDSMIALSAAAASAATAGARRVLLPL